MPKKNTYTLGGGGAVTNGNEKVRRTHGSTSSEDVAHWSAAHDAALKKFKMQAIDVLDKRHDNFDLMKWLKARDYDVGKAETMYRNHIKFRKEQNLDTLLDDYKLPEVMDKYMTGGILGHDKDGSPIRIELYGNLDIKGLMYSVKKEDFVKTKLYLNELLIKDWKEQTKLLGRRVDGLTVIFDMENITTAVMWRPGLHLYLELVQMLEDNYPETMKRMLVINAPRIFPLLWGICRPLMSEHTKQKIHVLGANYKEVLLQYIDAAELPAYLGGTLTDPDGSPRCQTMVQQGGQVPTSYYLKGEHQTENMDTTVINNGDKLQILKMITIPGSIIRWEFCTDEYDIGFGINYIPEKGHKVKPVLPVTRMNSHMVPIDGSFECKMIGPYKVVFDNSFSWARSKQLFYTVEVITPTDESTRREIDERVLNSDWTTMSKQLEATKI